MKMMFLTDLHLTSTPPVSRIDNFEATMYRKLYEVGKIIKDNKVDFVVIGGDLFHSPKVSLTVAGGIAQTLINWGVPIYVTPGNHDLFGYNLKTLGQTMLGFLNKVGIVKILDRKNPIEFNVEDKVVSIEGQEYYKDIDKGNADDYQVFNVTSDFKILVAHGMLLEKPFFDNTHFTLVQDVISDADLILAGHYHDGLKIQKHNGTVFYNPGALFRVESGRKDMPKVSIFDFKIVDGRVKPKVFEAFLASAEPREKVFNIAKKVEKQQLESEIFNFKNEISSLQQIRNCSMTGAVDMLANQPNVDPEILAKALEYSTNAESVLADSSTDFNGFIQKKDKVRISKVILENFQRHKHSVVEFKNGVNMITGESGKGKTSIERAIRWCLYDEPKGSQFIRIGQKSCKVRVEFDNGTFIERSRTLKSSGKYVICDTDGEIKEFAGFSNRLPIDIANIHQAPKITLSKDKKVSLNFNTQLESPFLLTESPAVKAEVVGKLTNTDVIDMASRECNKDILSIGKEIKTLETKKAQFDKELDKYKNLEEMKLKIMRLEFLDNQKSEVESKLEKLKLISDRLNKIHLKRISCTNIINKKDKIELLKAKSKDLEEKVLELEKLEKVCAKFTSNLERKEATFCNIAKFKSIISNKDKLIDADTKADELESVNRLRSKLILTRDKKASSLSKMDKSDKLNALKENLLIVLDKIDSFNIIIENNKKANNIKTKLAKSKELLDKKKDILRRSNDKFLKLENDFKEKVSEIKICPTCNNEINYESLI